MSTDRPTASTSSREHANQVENIEEAQTGLNPRDYQLEMVRLAKEEDVIVKLDTGSGKTFIASMLIQHMLPQTRHSLDDGGKRIVFLVKTVHLVEQQAKAIRSHTFLNDEVGEYHGHMSPSVDDYGAEKWHDEFEKHRVLVFSARVFLDLLNHAKFSITKVCLIVFDECHHARKEDDYAIICQLHLAQQPKCDRPKILGLTASVVNGKVKHLESSILELERHLMARVVTSSQSGASTFNEKIHVCKFNPGIPTEWFPLLSDLEQALEALKVLAPNNRKRLLEATEDQPKISFTQWLLDGGPTVEQRSKRAVSDCIQVLNSLGLWCAAEVARNVVASLEAAKSLTIGKEVAERARRKAVQALSGFLTHAEILGLPKFPTDRWVTDRVRQLVRVLEHYFGANFGDMQNHCVLFVDERQTAYALAKLLGNLRHVSPNLAANLHADFVTGHGGHDQTKEVAMDTKRQSKTLRDFRSGAVNVLVATRVVEEGMDVRTCNVVIKLSCPMEFRSFVQSSGRARLRNSKYVVMIPTSPKEEQQQTERLRSFLSLNEELKEKLTSRSVDYDWWSGEIDDLRMWRDIFQPGGRGGALIDRNSAMSVLNRYIGRLRHDSLVQPRVHVFLKPRNDEGVAGIVILPMPCPVRMALGPRCSNARQARAAAALEACRILYRENELGEDLLPKPLIPEEEEEEEDEEDEGGVGKVGTKKRSREYAIGLARELSSAQKSIRRRKSSFNLYLVEVRPQPSLLCRLDDDFGSISLRLAFLFPKNLTDTDRNNKVVAHWPLFFPGGTGNGTLVFKGSFMLEKSEMDLVENFHSVAMTSLFIAPPVKESRPFFKIDLVNSPLPFFCALAHEGGHLATETMQRVTGFRGARRLAALPSNLWRGALVTRDAAAGSQVAKENRMWIVKKVAAHLNPSSAFPDPSKGRTYHEYHSKITRCAIHNMQQPLIEVEPCPSVPWRLFHRPVEAGIGRQIVHQVHLVPELCKLLPLPFNAWLIVAQLPACLVRLNQLLLARWLHARLFATLPRHLPLQLRVKGDDPESGGNGSDLSDLVAAMTTAKVGDFGCLERLETMGDSFLKFAVSVALHANAKGPRESEGHLTARRTRLVRNATLFRKARERELWMFVQSQKFGPETFRPPAVDSDDDWTRTMNDKTIADFVEALIGFAYIHFDDQKALHLLHWLGLDLGMSKDEDGRYSLSEPQDPVLVPRTPDIEKMLDGLCDGLERVETILKYKFQNRAHLLQAMTHASCLENRITECYQKLEYLGDAVLDFVFTKYIFTTKTTSSPGDLTDLRSALVSNKTFAMIVVRSGLHRFLKHADPKLMQLIPEFSALMTEEVEDQDLAIAQFGSDASGQTVLKILGDIFEAVIGAVYLDSGRNLNTVWKVVRLLMFDIIEKYSENIPRNPIRLLYEQCPGFKFGTIEEIGRGMFRLIATYRGKSFSAEGRNKKSCKLDIARCFLVHFSQ